MTHFGSVQVRSTHLGVMSTRLTGNSLDVVIIFGSCAGRGPTLRHDIINKKRCTVICQKCTSIHRSYANNLLERDPQSLSTTAPAIFPPSRHLLLRVRDPGGRGYLASICCLKIGSKLHVTGVKIAAGFLWMRLKK